MPHLHFEHASPLAAHEATLPLRAHPLPNLKPLPDLTPGKDGYPRYTVLICGAGPAGMFSTLMLTRYGLPPPHILTIDASVTRTAGHADGIFARSQEVFDSLGLVDEIERDGGGAREHSIWAYHPPKSTSNGAAVNGDKEDAKPAPPNAPGIYGQARPGHLSHIVDAEGGIKRSTLTPALTTTSRYKATFRSLAQGRVERILEDDMLRYGGDPIVRGVKVVDVQIDDAEDEFSILATLEVVATGEVKKVRCAYLLGCDGGHSTVRRSLGVKMEGDTSDDIWGVVDFVPDTDFPDIRRVANLNCEKNSVLLIPRERNQKGQLTNRVYVSFDPEQDAEVSDGLRGDVEDDEDVKIEKKEKAQRQLRKAITLDKILARTENMFKPYRMRIKEGTEVDWWAAYQVGQRVSEKMVIKDGKGRPRVFLLGDASHTHSPKIGQGMNVSMMDGLDLSWKLAHVLFSLTPNATELLQSYEIERRDNALNLIDLDKRWYASRYGKSDDGKAKDPGLAVTWPQLQLEIVTFITGTSVEYPPTSLVVDKRRTTGTGSIEEVKAFSNGVLREGRRLADQAILTRFEDGFPVDLQRQCVTDGAYKIIAFATRDILNKAGTDFALLQRICDLPQQFPKSLLKPVVVHPLENHLAFEWTDLPEKMRSEVGSGFLGGDESVYEKYGVDPAEGVLAVIRPDQHIGTIADFDLGPRGLGKIEVYLRRVLVSL